MRFFSLCIILLIFTNCKKNNINSKKKVIWDLETSFKAPLRVIEFKQGKYSITVKSKKVENFNNYYMTIVNNETKTTSGTIEIDYLFMNEEDLCGILSFEDFDFDGKEELMIMDFYGGIGTNGFWIYDSETLKPKNLFVMHKDIDYFFIKDSQNLDVPPNKTIGTNYFKAIYYEFDKKNKKLNGYDSNGWGNSIIEEYKYNSKTRVYNIDYIETIN